MTPDYHIEEYWLSFKDSMYNFYNKYNMIPRPIELWSARLNELQTTKQYNIIETKIRDYISLYAIDVMRCQCNYHMSILITNIKRWNTLSTNYNFNSGESYYNSVFLLIDIYNSITNKCSTIDDNIKNIYNMVELYIINQDFYHIIKYAIQHNKPAILDKINKFKPSYDIIETIIGKNINTQMSGKKILQLIN